MDIRKLAGRMAFWRLLVQWLFLGWILYIGVQFGLFVHHFESGGAAPYYHRPPGVEGFLPIGALVSLKYWLTSGTIHPVHPAALVLFLTFLAMSLLTRKSFCSWLCPVGTLSEGFWKLGARFWGRNFQAWRWLDTLLRGAKYLLLLFFLKLILLDMPVLTLGAFLGSPYWAVSDIKMLHFFTNMSLTTMLVVLLLVLLSLVYKNPWCRYLCPYGALLGLLGSLSPFKIRRREDRCSSCQKCGRACPAHLPVQHKKVIRSPECTGCLTCIDNCSDAALSMSLPFPALQQPGWVFPILVMGIYTCGVLIGMLSGNWETSLSYQDYQRLMMILPQLSH